MSKVVEKIKVLLELVKFEHSIFALPYAYIGALYGARVLADHGLGWRIPLDYGRWVSVDIADPLSASTPTWHALAWITVAMVGARSFAFVVNRAADREIDARNPRTAGRAIPAGLIKAWELWIFSGVVLAIFLFAVWQLHPITRWLWPIVLTAFVVYPYTKRFTPLCHYWLGICLGLAPIGAWVAVGAPVTHPAPWVLGLAVALWTAGFDIIYATQDVECDVRDGVHSMPADIGVTSALRQTRVTHVMTVALLIIGGYLAGAGWPWYVGVTIAAVLLGYENLIVKPEDLSRVNAAFFTVNGMIAVIVFTGALLDRLLA
ncbi:MAG: UbiA-like polyprenyltransferase [Coriobacteriia bacterium]|nr:UbiA-like polyprenyltransferase [Coriobacteriia bacterium]